jgi:hypothetical protein
VSTNDWKPNDPVDKAVVPGKLFDVIDLVKLPPILIFTLLRVEHKVEDGEYKGVRISNEFKFPVVCILTSNHPHPTISSLISYVVFDNYCIRICCV